MNATEFNSIHRSENEIRLRQDQNAAFIQQSFVHDE